MDISTYIYTYWKTISPWKKLHCANKKIWQRLREK